MRIALVAEYPQSPDQVVGGVQAVVRQLATALARRRGLEVHAVSVQSRVPHLSPVEVMEGVHVHRLLQKGRLGNLTLGWAQRRATASALRRLRPDVVHVHGLGPSALGTRAAGAPWVATAHGMQAAERATARGWVNGVRTHCRVRMEKMSLQSLGHLIVISPYVLDYFGSLTSGIVTHAIENPVEDIFFAQAGQRSSDVVLFTGRLIPRKDLPTLVAATGLLAREGISLELRVAGEADDPGYLEEMRGLAEREGVADRIRFLGALPRASVARELARAAIYVQSSRQETASVSLMEAMAAGTAVTATDVGGTRYLVEDGVSGRLVRPGDPAALAAALASYLKDPAAARAAGEAGRHIAELRFRLDRVVDRTVEVYAQAMGAAPASPESAGSRGRN